MLQYDDFQFTDTIGNGVSSEVMKTRWHGTDVAVKRLLNQSETAENLERFYQEVFMSQSIGNHPRKRWLLDTLLI